MKSKSSHYAGDSREKYNFSVCQKCSAFFSVPRGKKGQMEMIGLVVIVILITLGMLIFASIEINRGPQKEKIFTREGLAYSALSALMKTTVQEGVCDFGRPILGDQVLEDCAANFEFYDQQFPTRSGFSNYACGGTDHSCQFFKQQVSELLVKTLGVWKKNYQFESIFIPFGEEQNFDPIINITSVTSSGEEVGCPKTREREASSIPLTIEDRGGQLLSFLYICD